MAMRAGLGPVDNVFQLTRRFMNALERPIGTSSGYSTVWHGYAPYNPAMLQQYLDLFRTAHNFCHTGDDKRTPAMRSRDWQNSRSATMTCCGRGKCRRHRRLNRRQPEWTCYPAGVPRK